MPDAADASPASAPATIAEAAPLDAPPNQLLEAALAYAGRGFQVHPVHAPIPAGAAQRCSCGDAECPSVGKHPRTKNGFKSATTDETQIRAWWSKWPGANIGIRTGPASGVFVLDIDPRHSGDATLADLIDEHGALPVTVQAATGGGGRHIFFMHPGQKVCSRPVADGIDCKGDGGYIVAAPSMHVSGSRYTWKPGCAPGEVAVAAAPGWVLELVLRQEKPKNRGNGSRRRFSEGQRNAALTSLAGRLRRGGLDRDAILSRLLEENAARCEPPLSDVEVRGIADSVSRYDPGPGEFSAYRMDAHGIYWDKPTASGSVPVALANFSARIERDILEDDGAERTRKFELVAAMPGSPACTGVVTADEFCAMSWPIPLLGSRAIIFPGHGSEAHVRTAIQLHSRNTLRSVVFGHTGWREIDGAWTYLHAGGGINAKGRNPDVQVALSGPLAGYLLPDPPSGADLASAINATLMLLCLGPDRLGYPLVSSIFRAILGGADFSVYIVGPTGSFKSETAALAQRHFGAAFTRTNLPMGWTSTPNAIEEAQFRAKDALLTVDDFKTSGDPNSDGRLHQTGDRVLRGQGNGSGRARLRPDGTPRPVRPPRCLTLVTGEELPRGESLRARLWIIEIAPGDVDAAVLTRCQSLAEQGWFAATTAAFCRWAAPRLGSLRQELMERAATLRAEFAGGHARQPGIMAELLTAFSIFVRFVRETTGDAVLNAHDPRALEESCRRSLLENAATQSQHQSNSEPTSRFLELVASAIVSGRAHVAGIEDDLPKDPQRWGWREERFGASREWQAKGERVGWVDEQDNLFLEPTAAYRAAQAGSSGDPIAVGEKTLAKRLHEKGLLVTTESGRSLRVRRSIGGKRIAVLHLRADVLLGRSEPDQEIPR